MKAILTVSFIIGCLLWHVIVNLQAHWIWWFFIIIGFGLIIYFHQHFSLQKKWYLIAIIMWLAVGLSTIYQSQITSQVNNENYYFMNNKFTIKKTLNNRYLVEDFKNQNQYWLFSDYYENGIRKKLTINLNDQIIGCGKIIIKKQPWNKKLLFNPSKINKWLILKPEKCQIKINKTNDFRNKIHDYLQKTHNPTVWKWINLWLFQKKTEEFQNIWTIITDINILHLFAISGFHLWLIFNLITWIIYKITHKKNQWWNKAIGLVFCLGMVYLTNWKLTTLKSFLLIICYCLFNKKNKYLHRMDYLAIIGWILLIINPWWIYQSGLQIGFLATWAIYYYWPILNHSKRKMFFFVNIFLPMILFPLIININYNLSPWYFLINLICSVLLTIYYPFFIIIIWFPQSKIILTWSLMLLTDILKMINYYNQSIVFGEWNEYSVGLYYLGIIFLNFGYKWHKSKIKWLSVWILIFTGLTFYNWYQPIPQFHMLNVQNGLAMVYQGVDKNTNILFDAGSGRKSINNHPKIKKYLWKLGIKKLDAVFISHHHTDHYNNLNYLMKYFQIKQIIRNQKQEKFYQINDLTIENLNFPYYQRMQTENNRSLVLKFKVNQKWILLTFDLEHKGELQLLSHPHLTKTDILQVGHHGLASASHIKFLQTIQPRYCLISNNKVIEKTINKLTKINCQTIITALKNDIVLNL